MAEKDRIIQRDCTVCGEPLQITVNVDGTYEGGHYFGEMTVPDEDSEGTFQKTGEFEDHDVVSWTGDETSFEYWECDECFSSETSRDMG